MHMYRYFSSCVLVLVLCIVTPSPCSGSEFVAYSLGAAERLIAEGIDYRQPQELKTLAGITEVVGVVYDTTTNDLILVGKRNPSRNPLSLDDLVVALRARFVYGAWPVASIDPTENMKETRKLKVRCEGGIKNTDFGADLLVADYDMKKVAFGLLQSGTPNIRPYFDLIFEERKATDLMNFESMSRFWFFPILPSVMSIL